VQLLEPRILRREAALARDIDDQQRLAVEVSEPRGLAVDGFERDVGGEGQSKLIGRCGSRARFNWRNQQTQESATTAGKVAESGIEAVISVH
jgi:hypothetical protein